MENGGASLMEENIKTKGENAYYYAHKRIVDDRFKEKEEGITITGVGIINGGDPVCIDVKKGKVEVIKENKKFTKYLFMDNDEFATIKIEFPDELKNVCKIEECKVTFSPKTLDIVVEAEGKDSYYYSVKKLFKKIVPDECTYKLSKNKDKLIINLKKKETDTEWDKLQD